MIRALALAFVAFACWLSVGSIRSQDGVQKASIDELVRDLASTDGGKRVAATVEIFRRGKDVLPDLKKAGAKQVAPIGGTIDGTRRLDIVYSVLEGLPPNNPRALAGYITGKFGLHVEKGTTEDDVKAICKKHGLTMTGKFNIEHRPSCYLQAQAGQKLDDAIRQVLANEAKVVTINLNYYER